MPDPSSRYFGLPTATHETTDGRSITYLRRRFIPPSSDLPMAGEVTVRQGERLDQLAARHLGQGEQFWRLADANEALDPATLEEPPGRRLRIPLPQAPALMGRG